MMRSAFLLACLTCVALAEKPSPVEILKGSRVAVIVYQRVSGKMNVDHVLTAANDPAGFRAELAEKFQTLGLDVVLVDDCAAATTDLVVGIMVPPKAGYSPSGDFVIRRRGQKKPVFQNGWSGRFDGSLHIDTPLSSEKLAEVRADIIGKLTLADFWRNFDSLMTGHSRGSGQSRWVPACF